MANYLNTTNISKLVAMILLFTSTTLTLILGAAGAASPGGGGNVRQACRATRYRGLCVRTLAPFSGAEGTGSPTGWARAGVSAADAEAENASRYVARLLGRRRGPRRRAALEDCAELLGDAVGGLRASLRVLGRQRRRATAAEVGDVATWLSAAMTDADTCLDGFRGRRHGKGLRARVSRARRVMSNALALVNRLASDP